MFKGYREHSRTNWGEDDESGNPTLEKINTGAILRIADACELMAKDRDRMECRLKWLESEHVRQGRLINKLMRSNAALRGIINRMKRQAKGTVK